MIRDDDEVAIGGDVAAPEDLRFQPSVEYCALGSAHRESAEPFQRRRQARSVGFSELCVRGHPMASVGARLGGEELEVRDGAQIGNFLRRNLAAPPPPAVTV